MMKSIQLSLSEMKTEDSRFKHGKLERKQILFDCDRILLILELIIRHYEVWHKSIMPIIIEYATGSVKIDVRVTKRIWRI